MNIVVLTFAIADFCLRAVSLKQYINLTKKQCRILGMIVFAGLLEFYTICILISQ